MSAFAKSHIFLSMLLIMLISILIIQPSKAQYPPHNLYVDSLTLGAQWDESRDILVDEDFENNEFPPMGWQAISQNTTGWFVTMDGSSENFTIPLHSTYVLISDEIDNGNGCCDYLITPAMDWTNLPDYRLNFSSFYNGAYSQQAYVEISTDGGENWMVIHNLSPYPYGWRDLEIDLSQYSGPNGLNNVLLAFHADDNGEWASGWAVDDITISSGSVPVLNYQIYLDSVFIGNTDETNYTFQNLVYGQEYLAGVAANYSIGLSEQDTFNFVSYFLYPPRNLQGTMPMGTDFAYLTWEHPDNGESSDNIPSGLSGYNIYKDSSMLAYLDYPAGEYYDLNLIPGFHSYYVTAVYDLTDYGYPGETGESMIEGPAHVDFICCNWLPFIENFNTGLFQTNQWTVDQGNWRIAGSTGNIAPSAEFYAYPETTDYSQSLTSFFMVGTDIIDGKILLEFDLKHTTVNPTGAEFLAVEILKNNSWVKVAEYSNNGSYEFVTRKINITNQALGNIFNIRFRAHGANSADIESWFVDNVHVYRICSAPSNLYVTMNFPDIYHFYLSWDSPANVVGDWLAWDNGFNDDAIGLNTGGTFSVASRFSSAQLLEYWNSSLTKIRLFPASPGGTIILKVWRGANAGELVYVQPVLAYTAGEWNEFILESPVTIVPNQELWFGYTVSHASDQYVAGCDDGPAIAGFGDMISINGSEWESMLTAYGLDFNWNLQGFVEGINSNSEVPFQPIEEKVAFHNNSKPIAGHLPKSEKASVKKDIPMNQDRSFLGYNVWYFGDFVDFTTDTFFYHDVQPYTSRWCYTVTAVYEDCESDSSNQACVYIDKINHVDAGKIKIYPNPSNSIINIELTNDISQIVIYNYVGQVVYEQIITKDKNIQLNVHTYEAGAYLIKFITYSGDSFTQKVAVTH